MADPKFFQNGPNTACFCLFWFFSQCKYKWWCAWDSNPEWQDERHRRIHWAMAASRPKRFPGMPFPQWNVPHATDIETSSFLLELAKICFNFFFEVLLSELKICLLQLVTFLLVSTLNDAKLLHFWEILFGLFRPFWPLWFAS